MDNESITVEKIIDDEFTKYVNNNGNPCQKVLAKWGFGAFFQWSKQWKVSAGWFAVGEL